MKRKTLLFAVISCLLSFNYYPSSAVASNSSKTTNNEIYISPQGQKLAHIATEALTSRHLPLYIEAPGEVVINSNYSAIVTSRIRAQVLKRLANVGETVAKGTPLVELTSVGMAQAQGELLLATKEWHRVKFLGREAVSAKRYQYAEVAYQQAFAKLIAYGMTQEQVKQFIQSDNPNKADGTFTLLAPRSGKVFLADFTEGQMIEPGNVLYKIVNESQLWINARLSTVDTETIKPGDKALIKTSYKTMPGYVLQVHPELDRKTRTQIVRLGVNNIHNQLRPGEFVSCHIQTGQTQMVLAVPRNALVLEPNGNEVIYIQTKPNYFKSIKIKVVKSIGNWRVIEGVNAGINIVTQGAFFVHSEIMKNNFSA